MEEHKFVEDRQPGYYPGGCTDTLPGPSATKTCFKDEEWMKQPSNLPRTALGSSILTAENTGASYLLEKLVGQVRSLEIMNNVLWTQVKHEREWSMKWLDTLDYERLKADAYRMVWSAREYLKIMYTHDATYDVSRNIFTNALWEMEQEKIDGYSIRAKYLKARENV